MSDFPYTDEQAEAYALDLMGNGCTLSRTAHFDYWRRDLARHVDAIQGAGGTVTFPEPPPDPYFAEQEGFSWRVVCRTNGREVAWFSYRPDVYSARDEARKLADRLNREAQA